MKKLTKDERWVAYVIMLHEAHNNQWSEKGYGLCHIINEVFGLSNNGFFENKPFISFAKVIELYFPELQKKKGNDWPGRNIEGWKIRKEFLKQCVEETG